MTETIHIGEESRFDRFHRISWWKQELLSASTVMVVGAGALGNEVIKNLALLGIGRLFVVDFDHIEKSNLVRSVLFRESDCGRPKAVVACEAAFQIDPECQAYPIVGNIQLDVGLSYFHASNLILGCLDNREARLWVNRCCWKVGRPWIDAGIQEIHGAIQAFASRQAPCYECGMKEEDYRLMQARYRCGDLPVESSSQGAIPTTPTIASILAGWQSQLAVKALHQLPVPWGKSLVFNGISDSTYTISLPSREDCLSHETWNLDMHLPDEANDWTVRRLFEWVESQAKGNGTRERVLLLERRLATSLYCEDCQLRLEWKMPRTKFGAGEGRCSRCSRWMTPSWIDFVDEESSYWDFRVRDLGFPEADWIRIRYDGELKTLSLPQSPSTTPAIPTGS